MTNLTLLTAVMAALVLPAQAQELRRVETEVVVIDFVSEETVMDAVDALDRVELNAIDVRDRAARLKSFVRMPNLHSWKMHALQLDRIKADVNDMVDQLMELNGVDYMLLPRQDLALDHIRPDLAVLAEKTEKAIKFVNKHKGEFWNDDYESLANQIYDRADDIAQAADMAESRADVLEFLEEETQQ